MSNEVQRVEQGQGQKAIKKLFEQASGRMMEIAPRGLDANKMMRVALLAINKTPKLQQCTPASLLQGMMDATAMGLEIGTRAYLVPYWDGNDKVNKAVMIPDYRGLIDLAWKHARIRIEPQCRFANDYFELELGDSPKLKHIPNLENPGEVVGAYAILRTEDGQVIHREYMSRDQIEHIRQKSRAKDADTWTQNFPQMARKTVTRRAFNYIPQSGTSNELAELVRVADENEFGPATFEEAHSDDEPKLPPAGRHRTARKRPESTQATQSSPEAVEADGEPATAYLTRTLLLSGIPAGDSDAEQLSDLGFIYSPESKTFHAAFTDERADLAEELASQHPGASMEVV